MYQHTVSIFLTSVSLLWLIWDFSPHSSFNEENHNCYSYTLMFINCVLAMQSKRALSKDEFTQTFILPRVKRASKYTMLCQEISQNHFFIVDSPNRDTQEGQHDEDKDGKSKS